MRRSRRFIVVAASALVMLATACSNQKSSTGINVGGPVSPFAASRVQLDPKSFSETETQGIPLLSPDTQLIAKIDNKCAIEWCVDGAGGESITCPAFSAAFDSRLKETYQVYDIPNPGPLSNDDLLAWISSSRVDQECIRGVSELQHYKANGFNDTLYNLQTTTMGLIEFEASQTYFPATALAPVKVAVIDSGIAADSDLGVVGRVSYSVFTVANGSTTPLFANDDQTKPNNSHGTFIAGIIGAKQNNFDKMVGLAPNAQLFAYGIGNSEGSMTSREIANAISAAVIDGMEVVNCSFGQVGGAYNDDPMVRDGIVQGYLSNIVFVAAAGNENKSLLSTKTYPAQYAGDLNNVIAVAASDEVGLRASFSNYGGPVNIVAPGVNVWSITNTGSLVAGNGTSFAAPMVTGAVSLAIGTLKKKNLPYTPDTIRTLVTYSGANLRGDLTAVSKNGAFLNLRLLGAAVQTESARLPLSITSTMGKDALGNPTLQLTVSWDSTRLPAFDPAERLGVFDTSTGCNFSLPCLLGSVSYANSGATCDAAGQCTLAMTISRAQLIAMMGSKSDPASRLPVTVAFYHTVYDPVTGKPKNNYSVELSAVLDLRKVNGNTGEPVFGTITNIRMDMSNLYVEGWACRPKSEEAVTIKLVDALGASIVADYAYNWSLMVPHGTPIDYSYMWATKITNNPHMEAFYVKGDLLQKDRSFYLAGLEGHAGLVDKCGTFTGAHGFEFAVPLKDIEDLDLAGKTFKVIADNKVEMKDENGRAAFEFPDPPASTLSEPAFTVNRASSQFLLSGNVCSSSPSPIVAEITYSNYNAVWALTGKEPKGSPNRPFVNDPKLLPTAAIPLPVELVSNKSATDMTLSIAAGSLNPAEVATDGYTMIYVAATGAKPNAYVDGPSVFGSTSPELLGTFKQNVDAYGFKRVKTAESIRYVAQSMYVAAGTIHSAERAAVDRARINGGLNAPYDFNWNYWDYYDVGIPFSLNLIGYDMERYHYRSVAAYLKDTYQVTTLLRDAKKYETPLSLGNTTLGLTPLQLNGSCANQQFKHTLASWSVQNTSQRFPYFVQGQQGFWLEGLEPTLSPVETLEAAALRLPLTVRFFQDGKMVLHLESQATSPSTFVQVPYEY